MHVSIHYHVCKIPALIFWTSRYGDTNSTAGLRPASPRLEVFDDGQRQRQLPGQDGVPGPAQARQESRETEALRQDFHEDV